jgi:hypothetical protein
MTPFASLKPRAQAMPSPGIRIPDLRPRNAGNFSIAPRMTEADSARRERLLKTLVNGR